MTSRILRPDVSPRSSARGRALALLTLVCALAVSLLPAAPARSAAVISKASAIAPGSSSTCAITVVGRVRCWGFGASGELGIGAHSSLTPVTVTALGTGVAQVSVGADDACALTSGGGVKCWGQNLEGAVGDGTRTERDTPVDVLGLTSGVARITTGVGFACAVTTGGGAKCWGQNDGDLGDGTTRQRHQPVDVVGLTSGVASVSAGAGFACALTTGGGVKCWGDNFYGELGHGPGGYTTVPGDVTGLTSGVSQISAGDSHVCALLDTGGLMCWGDNAGGDLGDHTTVQRDTPVAVAGLSSGVVSVVAGGGHTCALLGSGGEKCWGLNGNGQVGDGSPAMRRVVPTDVAGLTAGVASIGAGQLDSCAVMATGPAKCWGVNDSGELGDGSLTDRRLPTDVYSMPNVPGPPVFGHMSPTRGKVDRQVTIFGSGFLGALAVSFHGRPAGFDVQSDTQITTWVPAKATTGKVAVTTPQGASSSHTVFTVVPG